MELVRFTNELSVGLELPQCDLRYDHCEGEAEKFYDVHGCAQYYACRYCSRVLSATMLESFAKYELLTCKVCGVAVTLPTYVNITALKEEKRVA